MQCMRVMRLTLIKHCVCVCARLQVGAEELAPEEYKAASELRARLTSALRVKQQLETALKGLAATSLGTGPRGRQLEQLAEPVEAAIKEAARYGNNSAGPAGSSQHCGVL